MSNQTTAVSKGEQMQTVQGLLKKMSGQFQMALPKHITPDKMIRLATTAISKNPTLLECTQTSLLGAIMQSAQLGLAPDGVLGEAYLLPFKNWKKNNAYECQFIVGYRGLISLAMRSGVVSRFQARAVFEGDVFNYEYGLNETLTHIPKGTKGELTHVYAVLQYKDGGSVFEVMSKDEVNFTRDKSQGKNNGVWKDYYEEMAKKTVIRKLAKIAPLSPEFNTAVGLDEQHEVLGQSQKNDVTLINLDELPDLQQQAAETIDVDAEIMEKEKVEAEQANTKAKGAAATDATLNAINGGKK